MMYLLLKMDSDNGDPCNITIVPKPAFYSYLQVGLDWQEENR